MGYVSSKGWYSPEEKSTYLFYKYCIAYFRLDKKVDQQKYAELLLDFSFFKQMEEFDKKLSSNEALRDLDDEIRDNNLEIVSRFYLLFESIYKYIMDLNRFIRDLEEGLYIQQTTETVFVPDEGKQLMVSRYLHSRYIGNVKFQSSFALIGVGT